MTTEQAKQILGITDRDNARTAKIKFRRLIGKYHPDAAGEDFPDDQERAREVNAAYSFLRNRNFFREREEEAFPLKEAEFLLWRAQINESAYVSRNIYVPYHMDIDTEGLYQTAANGKYMWNPEEEEFAFFLRSIFHAAKELLDEAEAGCGVCDGMDTVRLPFQERLFHALAQQFIDPLECLGKIAEPERAAAEPIYTFRAYIGEKRDPATMRRLASLQTGDAVYPAALKEWRLIVADSRGNRLGHLSFAEDALYYCLFPLLRAHLGKVKMTVRRVQKNKGSYLRSVRAEITFQIKLMKTAEEYHMPDVTPEIERLLAQYRRALTKR